MFPLLRRLALLAMCLIVIGLWRGWFSFSHNKPNRSPNGEQMSINVSVDEKKVKADAATVKQEIRENVIPKVKELVNDVKAPPAK